MKFRFLVFVLLSVSCYGVDRAEKKFLGDIGKILRDINLLEPGVVRDELGNRVKACMEEFERVKSLEEVRKDLAQIEQEVSREQDKQFEDVGSVEMSDVLDVVGFKQPTLLQQVKTEKARLAQLRERVYKISIGSMSIRGSLIPVLNHHEQVLNSFFSEKKIDAHVVKQARVELNKVSEALNLREKLEAKVRSLKDAWEEQKNKFMPSGKVLLHTRLIEIASKDYSSFGADAIKKWLEESSVSTTFPCS